MPESSLVYDLGQHVVELSPEGMMLITHVFADTTSLKEGVQLDKNEVYRLCTVLQEWFREDR